MAAAKICEVRGCGRPAKARGLCNAHRARQRRYGDPSAGGLLRDEMLPTCTIRGCEQPREALGLCGRHYANLRRRGDALSGPSKAANSSHRAWVEAHVGHEGDNCLTWPFGDGYGSVRIDGRQVKAHRYMCRLAHGEPPTPRHQAAHSCGKGHEGCIHPQHLRWDTAKGNHADRYEHGTINLGEDCWNAVLTEEGVRWARSMAGKMTYRAMAARLGVHRGTVRAAVVRSTWAWLD